MVERDTGVCEVEKWKGGHDSVPCSEHSHVQRVFS